MNKNISTLNLVLCSTAFVDNNCTQTHSVALNETSTLLNILNRLFSSSLRFAGWLFPTAKFSSFYRCSMGLRSTLIAGHFKMFSSNSFSGAFWHMIWILDQWSEHTRLYDFLQNSLIVFWFHHALHRFKVPSGRGSKASPEHRASSIFHSSSFLRKLQFSFCKQSWCELPKSSLSHLLKGHAPKMTVAFQHAFRQTPVILFVFLC